MQGTSKIVCDAQWIYEHGYLGGVRRVLHQKLTTTALGNASFSNRGISAFQKDRSGAVWDMEQNEGSWEEGEQEMTEAVPAKHA